MGTGNRQAWHSITLALSLFLLGLSEATEAAERVVARMGELQATVSQTEWCGSTVDVRVHAPHRELLTDDSRELQLIAGGVRQILGLECPQVRVLQLTGLVDDQTIGRWQQHSDGRFLAIPSAASGDTAAEARAADTPPQRTQVQRVTEVQALLTRLGYQPGPVDGLMGSRTRSAIATFLRDHRLPPTHEVDDALLVRLRLAQCGNRDACDGGTPAQDAPPGLPDRIQTASLLPDQAPTTPPSPPTSAASATAATQSAATPPPAALPAMAETLPTWNGRLLAMGSRSIPGLIPKDAVMRLGEAALLIALKQNPDLIEDDDRAFDYFHLLDETAQRQIAEAASVAPDKVVGVERLRLDEFERRAMLTQIRADAVPLLINRAPPLPIPVLAVCRVAFQDYDFDRQEFRITGTPPCEAIDLSPSGSRGAELTALSVTAPLPTHRLPTVVSIPIAEAQAYKRQHLDMPEDLDTRDLIHLQGTAYAIEAQLVGLNAVPSQRGRQHYQAFEVEVEVENILLFRPDDLSRPFQHLEPNPRPSLASVSAEPAGEVFLNAETASLLRLASDPLDFDDNDFREWLSARAKQESGADWHAAPWASFFHPDIARSLSRGTSEPQSWLVENFSEWTRARAAALPETLWLSTGRANVEWPTVEEPPAALSVFDEPGSSRARRYTTLSKRLGVPQERLVVPRGGSDSQWLIGLGEEVGLVFILSAPRQAYTLDLAPGSEAGERLLNMAVAVSVGEIRLNRVAEGAPLLAIEVEPRSARATTQADDRTEKEVATTSFDIATSTAPVEGDDPDTLSAAPFTAEFADLLQLKYLPDTVDDRLMMRMMLSRFAYEERAPEPLMGGRFFPDVSRRPSQAEFTRRLAEFRDWSEQRTQRLPERLTLTLRLHHGVVQNESWGKEPYYFDCDRGRLEHAEAESPTEQLAMQRRLCEFLETAWSTPDRTLWLRDTSFNARFSPHDGRGPRYRCQQSDLYCRAIREARTQSGLPSGENGTRINHRDLVSVDRLPVLDEAHRALDGNLDVELDIQPTGAHRPEVWPDTTWAAALRQAAPFADRHGLALPPPPERHQNPPHTLVFEAVTLAARIVDRETGELRAELSLAPPTPLPLALLDAPDSPDLDLDVLGIGLGTSFADAEALIRDHMEVGRVLIADRTVQATTLSGELAPYSSGRMFVSRDEQELITLFDEPPAAPNQVVAIRRQLRLPHGSVDMAGLKATLEQRYGTPVFSQPVQTLGSNRDIEFVWSEYPPSAQCQSLSSNHEPDLWFEESGEPAAPPAYLNNHYYPSFASGGSFMFVGITGDVQPLNQFCPELLGVRIASYPNMTPAYDEIVTWLYNQRHYAQQYFESRERQDELIDDESSHAADSSAPAIKF